MAERKLRTDTAHTAAAIPQPHIRVPTPDAGSFATADGPVQPDSKSPVIKESLDDSPSSLERAVRQKLISAPEVSIASLLVQQIEGGVCLYGILEYARRHDRRGKSGSERRKCRPSPQPPCTPPA